jgi:hypothetical protein
LCRQAAADAACARVLQWTNAMQVIGSDLNRGHQYSAKGR